MSGAGSINLVRFGRGELGSEGGSWAGAGVLASFDIVCDGVEAVRMLAGQLPVRDALAKARSVRGTFVTTASATFP